jgi:hypothetical protein
VDRQGLPPYGGALVAEFNGLKPGDEAIIQYKLFGINEHDYARLRAHEIKQLTLELAPRLHCHLICEWQKALTYLFGAVWQVAGPVAQRLEQGTHNPLVGGSNPSGPTI